MAVTEEMVMGLSNRIENLNGTILSLMYTLSMRHSNPGSSATTEKDNKELDKIVELLTSNINSTNFLTTVMLVQMGRLPESALLSHPLYRSLLGTQQINGDGVATTSRVSQPTNNNNQSILGSKRMHLEHTKIAVYNGGNPSNLQ